MSVTTLKEENKILLRRNAELEKRIPILENQVQRIPKLEAKIDHLMEALYVALHRMWGRSSEKYAGQMDLPFEDLLSEETPKSVEADSEKAEQTRQKKGRKPLSDQLPRKDILHDLETDQKTCACGHELKQIGEDICEKLAMIPAQIWVDRHHYPKYACPHCQGLADETKPAVTTAHREPDLIARSIVSASLLAHVWTSKFCDHLPFYRQEVGFARIGAQISRQDMVNWTIKVTAMLEPLIERLEQVIREGPVIQMDETPVTVLDMKRTGKAGQGYMWLARGGPKDHKVVRYRYAPGRGSEHAKKLLKGWEEFLQTDGYSAYVTALDGTQIIHVGCWAHARRKFVEAEKVAPSELTKDALGRIRKLYELEKKARDEAKKLELSDEAFLTYRKTLLGDYLADLKTWLEKNAASTLPSGKVGKAFAYTLGQWDKLVRFLDHAWLTPDNNAAENAIRPFVLGRKNWLFSGNDEGAEASCRVFTLIETAKINGVEPYVYLRTLLEKLPATIVSRDWDSLLPWNLNTGLI